MSCECPFLVKGDKIIKGFKDSDISPEAAQAMTKVYQDFLSKYGPAIFCSILSAQTQNIRLCNHLDGDYSGCDLRRSRSN